MRRTAAHIRGRRQRVIQQASPRLDLLALEILDFEQGVLHSYSRLSWICRLLEEVHRNAMNAFQTTSVLVKYQADALPTIPCSSKDYVVYNLKPLKHVWHWGCLNGWSTTKAMGTSAESWLP